MSDRYLYIFIYIYIYKRLEVNIIKAYKKILGKLASKAFNLKKVEVKKSSICDFLVAFLYNWSGST